ncbi:MAG: MBL fold metallo-hydrolase [Lachnospiraceae bacterium]|nr:MBL fold metallo-hydrolase [Lachnospiraceae bacterium]
MNKTASGYAIQKTGPDTTMILDSFGEALYLIEGRDRAVLVDTGMDGENLREVVDGLTKKPVSVFLTHGHIDHIGRTGDFETVYLKKEDRPLYREHMNADFNGSGSRALSFMSPDRIRDMPDGIDLGDRRLCVIPLPGHTPGSVLLADSRYRTVYTGDAIGSGMGVWMQIPGCLCVSAYRDHLRTAIGRLRDEKADSSWKFCGGHDGQEYTSRVAPFNRLGLPLMEDMLTLCGKLLEGAVEPEPVNVLSEPGQQPFYAAWGQAEMIVTKNRIL